MISDELYSIELLLLEMTQPGNPFSLSHHVTKIREKLDNIRLHDNGSHRQRFAVGRHAVSRQDLAADNILWSGAPDDATHVRMVNNVLVYEKRSENGLGRKWWCKESGWSSTSPWSHHFNITARTPK